MLKKLIRNAAFVTILAVSMLLVNFGLQPSTSSAAGTFTVQGTKIIGPDNKEFVAKGTNINGYNTAWGGDTIGHLSLVKDCWKFNLVRVYCRIDPNYNGYNKDMNYLYNVLDTYTAAGIVCMVEVHDKTGSYFTDSSSPSLNDLANWHKNLAIRYKNNPYVWFNVMNEPGGTECNSTQYLATHQRVIQAIRDGAGASNIIVCDGWDWAQDSCQFNNNNVNESKSAILSLGSSLKSFGGKTYNNIVFSLHTYREWVWGQSKLDDFLDRVAAKGHALIIGEYGSYTNADTTDATTYMFNECVPRNIGRVVWHWYGGDRNDLTTSGGGHLINKTDGSKPTNLTWLGNKVWDDNHSNNSSTPTPTPTATPTPTVSPTPTPPPTSTNIALNKPATASSTYSSNNASNAVDGNTSTYWRANSAPAQWLKVDLGSSKTMTGYELKIYHTDRYYQFTIDVSNDGTNWTTVVDKRSNTSLTQNFSGSFSATGRYVRVYIHSVQNSPWPGIYEFKVFGN